MDNEYQKAIEQLEEVYKCFDPNVTQKQLPWDEIFYDLRSALLNANGQFSKEAHQEVVVQFAKLIHSSLMVAKWHQLLSESAANR